MTISTYAGGGALAPAGRAGEPHRVAHDVFGDGHAPHELLQREDVRGPEHALELYQTLKHERKA